MNDELTKSDEWAARRQTDKQTAKRVYDYCASRQLRCEEHNSHGLYFDVWSGGRRFMFDCSPEDEPHEARCGTGLVVVRDSSDGWENMPVLGKLIMQSDVAPALLDSILEIE